MNDFKSMKKVTFFILYFLIILSIYCKIDTKILYISSFNLQYPVARIKLEGVLEGLGAESRSNVTIEFLNSHKFYDGEVHDQLHETLLLKLRNNFDFDAVIVGGDDALLFVEKNYSELFSEIPIVFFHVIDGKLAGKMSLRSNIVGVGLETSIQDNIQLIDELYPDKSLVVLYDKTLVGESTLDTVLNFPRKKPIIKINLAEITWEELPGKLRQFGDSPLYINSFYEDKNREAKLFLESFKIIEENHDGAVFFFWEHSFETGRVLGGKMGSHQKVAKEAGELLLSILDGAEYQKLEMIKSKNRYVVDYQEMKRLKLSKKQFPHWTIYVNKPETLWAKYKVYIILLIIIAITTYGVVILLLFQIKAKNAVEKELNKSKEKLKRNKDELRKIIDLIPSHIYVKDADTRFLLINKTSAESFDKKPEEVEGLRHIDLHGNIGEALEFQKEDLKVINGEVNEIIQYSNLVTVKDEKRYYYTVKIPFPTESGKVAVLGISTDITDRTVMQEELDRKNVELIERNREIIETQRDVIEKLGNIIEHRSKETANHVKRVSKMAGLLAKKYGLTTKEAELVEIAVPMHDVGKIAIKEEILHKPGKLSSEEFELMKKHAEIGFNLLHGSNREILRAAAIIAFEHHERWDGTGYPHKKRGEKIHLYGRITSICDVFDALVSERSYKRAWSFDEAFAFIQEQRAKMFDPKLVDIFLENRASIEEIKNTYED